MTTTKNSLSRGEYVFREGETGGYAYILNEGEVEIVKSSPDGTMVLQDVEKGALFGEMAIIIGGTRTASALVRSDAVVTEIDSQSFLDHLAQKPQTALSLLKRLAVYVRDTNILLSDSPTITGDDAGSVVPDGETPNSSGIFGHEPSHIADVVDDTDAIYDAPLSRPLLLVGGTVVAFLMAAVVFVSITFVDTTVSARGKFFTKVPNVQVQVSSNSVINSLLVERGQLVNKGDVVVELDGTYVKASLRVVTEKLAGVKNRILRIQTEQKLINTGKAIPAGLQLDEINADILAKRLDEYRSRISSFATRISKQDHDIISARSSIVIDREQLEVKNMVEIARKRLYDQQIGSLLNYLTAKSSRLQAKKQLAQTTNSVKNLDIQSASILAERQAFVAQWSSELAETLAKEKELNTQLTEEMVKLSRQASDLFVRSPANGIVLDMPTVSDGSIVREGDSILTLVRTNVPLALEIDVDPKDISNMRIGAAVSIKLDALPFQQYGDIKGTLVFISDDTFSESLFGEKGTFYRGRVEMATDTQKRLPDEFQLTPGMLANADLKVGERRLVTYFTHPITKNFGQAFREPD
jgi:HlyD family secretion protein